jgi:DNA polymerase-1
MIQVGSMQFREVWSVDFEFISLPGENPMPVCLVAHELDSGRQIRIWEDKLKDMHLPPYAIDEGALFVAYYASAEMGCHISLGWTQSMHAVRMLSALMSGPRRAQGADQN